MRRYVSVLCLALMCPALASAQESGRVLLEARFDSPGDLDDWERMVGASTGSGPSSLAEWHDSAVRLSGDAGIANWVSPTRRVAVHGAEWIRVTVRMRTDGVDPTHATYRNCNLFIRDDAGIVGTRVVSGTNDWISVVRRFPVAPGTREITVGMLLSMPGQVWFDDLIIESAEAPQWTETIAGHYRYFTLPGDPIPDHARVFNDQSFVVVSDFLGVLGPALVDYYKYPSLAVSQELTGFSGNARREGQVIHSIWPSDRHEIVHVMADSWGDPPALIAEGLAVYLSGGWQNVPVKAYAAGVLLRDAWLPLGSILSSTDFRGRDDLTTYAIGGALVQWIVDTAGRDHLRAIYGALDNNAPTASNRATLERLLGMGLDEADAALRAWLRE